MSDKITTGWPIITRDIVGITKPAVEWKTILRSFYQLTAEIAGIPDAVGVAGTPATPATYRGWVSPIDLNDPGAIDADIQEGYILQDILGNKFPVMAINVDGSIDVSDELLCGYCPISGRPGIVFNATETVSHPKPPPPPPPVVTTKWFDEDLSCVMVAGINTGEQIGVSREKTLNPVTGLWVNTGHETPIDRINYVACPLPAPDPSFMAMCVNATTYDQPNEEIIPMTSGILRIRTPAKAGDNYLFFSVPTVIGRPVILNSNSHDISYQFLSDGSDNRTGYQPNTIWKRGSTFDTTFHTSMTLVIP